MGWTIALWLDVRELQIRNRRFELRACVLPDVTGFVVPIDTPRYEAVKSADLTPYKGYCLERCYAARITTVLPCAAYENSMNKLKVPICFSALPCPSVASSPAPKLNPLLL